MIEGIFRDGHPRITLSLPGVNGPVQVSFILDTGFDGDLALPGDIVRQVDARFAGSRNRLLADGSLVRCPCYELFWEDDEQERQAEILVIEGKPLLGTQFFADYLLQIEMTEGGEVTAEPL